MNSDIDLAIDYAAQHHGYRASIGLISEESAHLTRLTWAAHNPQTGDFWFPGIELALKRHPALTWQPLTSAQLRLYLESQRDNPHIKQAVNFAKTS